MRKSVQIKYRKHIIVLNKHGAHIYVQYPSIYKAALTLSQLEKFKASTMLFRAKSAVNYLIAKTRHTHELSRVLNSMPRV